MSELGYEDGFGKAIADTTTNEIDLGAHYRYTPERWLMRVDGSRVFPEYDTVDQYEHATDVHKLDPNAGETVVFQSAERPRYTVQYEQEITHAFSYNQSLQSGDIIRIGYFTDQNGWYLEKNSNHDDLQVDLVIRRSGVEKKRIEDLTLEDPLSEWNRLSFRLNWYNVGRALCFQTYTEGNQQLNSAVGNISIDDGSRGPAKGNLHIRYEVTAGSGTSNLVLDAGSVGMSTLGDVDSIKRVKQTDFEQTVGTTGTWVPLRAFRIKPNDDIVNVQIRTLEALRYSQDNDIRILAIGVPQQKVTFGGGDSWSTPNDWSASNNAVETRTDIATIPDSDGNQVSNSNNPGGFQIGRDVLLPVGGQFQKGQSSSSDVVEKRNIYEDDYGIILGKSPQNGNVTYGISLEQDW